MVAKIRREVGIQLSYPFVRPNGNANRNLLPWAGSRGGVTGKIKACLTSAGHTITCLELSYIKVPVTTTPERCCKPWPSPPDVKRSSPATSWLWAGRSTAARPDSQPLPHRLRTGRFRAQRKVPHHHPRRGRIGSICRSTPARDTTPGCKQLLPRFGRVCFGSLRRCGPSL